jgi:cytochrome c
MSNGRFFSSVRQNNTNQKKSIKSMKSILIYFSIINLFLIRNNLLADEDSEKHFYLMEKNNIANMESIEEGRKQYGMNCLFCHGPKGKGARAPTLVANGFIPNGTYDNKYFMMTIKNGKNGTIMGSFEEILSDSEIWNIIAYLRNEAKNQNTENN